MPAKWDVALDNFVSGLEKAKKAGEETYYLSVSGNLGAQRFRRFVAKHCVGTVLDVGCGPQSKPLYLYDIPDEWITGVDPIFAEHPFEFFHGCIEDFPERSFGTVICATSLDHLRNLEVAALVMKRAEHKILIWGGDKDPTPPEQHTFHVRHEWLIKTFGTPLARDGDYFCFEVNHENSD